MLLSDIDILNLAKQVSANSYSPYSNFKVGAALLTASGDVFLGTNVENAAYPVSLCAERASISNAVSKGFTNFIKMAVVASGDKPISPCGMCRQALAEFAPNLVVICASYGQLAKQEFDLYNLDKLLPSAFLNF